MRAFRHAARGITVAVLALLPMLAAAQDPLTTRCESAPILTQFTVFSQTGRMPPDLDVAVQAFETPGHTMGTISFAFDARDGARTFRAFTIGGLGLNAIRGPEQVEAFIASVKRIRALTEDKVRPVELHLTTHPFSNGLTEAKELLKARQPGEPHPLVDLPGFRKQLDALQEGAEKRLIIERQKTRS